MATTRFDTAAASAIHTNSDRRSRRGNTRPTVGATKSPTSAVTVTVCPAWPGVTPRPSAISVSTPLGRNSAVTSRKPITMRAMSPP